MSGPRHTFKARTGLSGVVVSDGFPMRGFAHVLGLDWHEGPALLQEGALRRLTKTLGALLDRHDFIYVHLRIETVDPVERLCVMERIDQLVLKPLTETLPARGSWRLMVAVDGRPRGVLPVIAIGTGLPQHPVARLDAPSLAESDLVFTDGPSVFAWLRCGER